MVSWLLITVLIVLSQWIILYTYQIEDYHFEMFLQYSLRPLDIQVEVLKIKESWCAILDG